MAGKKKCTSDSKNQRELKVGAAELFGALGYMTDITLTGCRYHTWRVALVAHRIAMDFAPDIKRDVFYAGLLQDIGTVGARKHITEFKSMKEQLISLHIKTHPERGGALLDLLPGMADVAQYVRSHHEWINGRGYPGEQSGSEIPLGAQILRIADEANIAGCFTGNHNIMLRLRSISSLTGKAWTKELWEALLYSLEDGPFYKALMDSTELPALMSKTLGETTVPAKLANEQNIERIFHIFAALTDAADAPKTGHAINTARYACAIANHMQLSEKDIVMTYHAGLIHDCGRAAVPQSVLNRQGRLTKEELNIMRQHALATNRIMKCIPYRYAMANLGEIAASHHEWMDGRGYPNHLIGKNLHPITRILSVADAFDSMMSVASYRMLSPKCVMKRLKESAGTQFDPKVVDALIEMVENGELDSEMRSAA